MRISEAWLREWVDPDMDTETLARRLTMAGLEVGAVEAAAPPCSGVVVGEVLACEGHPDADKLSVCEVNVGAAAGLSIVCGAPNVRAGLRVAVAVVGARLAGDVKIRKAKLRGVPSEGMICSARELGLGDEHDGILELPADAPVGDDFRAYLALDDAILELELTPNRGDCLGMAGVAREVAALCRVPLTPPAAATVPVTSDKTFSVRISAASACPRYVGRVVAGIHNGVATPLWMRERLRRGGIRSLGIVVDVTNYVLLETGQPMHGFDLDQLAGAIDVRNAGAGERLTLLDGREVTLDDDILVIADDTGPMAMAGIMGGERSGVGPDTRDVFFESAFFAPLAVAGKARRFGLHTDASHRFERGVDPDGQVVAIERATELLVAIAGGEAGPLTLAESADELPQPVTIALQAARLESHLGTHVDGKTVSGIFERLGCQLVDDGNGWTVTPPPFRFDIRIAEDLIEEVARVHGYERIPERAETAQLSIRPVTETRVPLARVEDALVDRGYQEVFTYSFIDPAVHDVVCPGVAALPLANPIASDLAVMRASLWPGLIGVLRHNLARQVQRMRLFESGLTFITQGDELKQEKYLATAIVGNRYEPHWARPETPSDFYDLAGDVAALLGLAGAGVDVAAEAAAHPALHPGQSARVMVDGKPAGWLGSLHPERARSLEIEVPVWLAELHVETAFGARVPVFEPISRHPALRRDISVIVDDDVTVAAMNAAIREVAPPALRKLLIFDVYRGQGIDSGRKSVSFGLILQDSSRTLSDSQADEAVRAAVAKLEQDFDGKIRD